MSTSTLPAYRNFVTQLLNSLPSLQIDDAISNPLLDAPELVKKQLLTLQVFFPNEFLPALDLLDRKLVARFHVGIEDSNPPIANNVPTDADVQVQDNHNSLSGSNTTDTVYYVRSAQQRSSRFSTSYDSTVSYEVRLRAWNCTCPAFAFAAFPSAHPEPVVPVHTPPSNLANNGYQHEDVEAEKKALAWIFGGVSLGDGMPPVCKHLLACVLGDKCIGVFGKYVVERKVSVETAAGWAAGWGDS